jgi:hypothetical protein
MPFISATLVPGRSCRCRSALRAVWVRRGSTTIILGARAARRAWMMRRHTWGCISAGLVPIRKKQSVFSMSS